MQQTTHYCYEALGRRVQRYIVGGKENTKFIYDGQDVLVDDDHHGTLTKYINGDGIDNKLKMRTGNDVRYFLADHLGSTNALADSTGNLTSSASYDSFGNATGNLTTRYQFTGREFDNFTNLYYYRARWYDGNLGRFISEDPIGLAGGVNLYGSVGNNPLGATDSMGLSPEYDQQVWRAQQDLLEALQVPIEYSMGLADDLLVFPRYVRKWQGIDTPNLDCSAAYQAGQWTAFGIDVATGVGGLVKGAGKYAAKRTLKNGFKVASNGGKTQLGVTVRQINKGENVKGLIDEVAQLTYESGGVEHAIISLKNGTRLIVRGGENGINFAKYDVNRVILHTHRSPTGPSAIDFQMLRDTGQRSSYIYELFGGGLTKFSR